MVFLHIQRQRARGQGAAVLSSCVQPGDPIPLLNTALSQQIQPWRNEKPQTRFLLSPVPEEGRTD